MKPYGYDRGVMFTCFYGCCGCKKNPNLCGKRSNSTPYDRRAKKTARQASKKQIKEANS